MVAAAATTYSEKTGGPLPTWNELYAAAGLLQPVHLPEETNGAATRIHFIDVGQADATLIEQNGEFALIDAGDTDSEQDLLHYLDAVGVETIKLLVMTHPHADHIGSMRAVLQKYKIEQVLLPALSKAPAVDNSLALWTLNMIDSLKIPKRTAKAGQEYKIGEGTLTVLSNGIKTKDDYNDISVITKFTAQGVSFLSCGDATSAEEKALLESKYDPSARLYKAAHHGSASSNRTAFLEAVSPRMVVVSCGKENDYGHPHKESLKAFAKAGAQVFRTDTDGSCIAYVDANGKLQMAVTDAAQQKAA